MTALEEWGDAAWEREGHVNRYLGRSPLKRAVTKQDLTELTANQVIIMMKTQQVITYLVHDYFDRATARHPLTGELQESTHESLALHEKSRLFHAFYRWELWNVLFGIDVDETEFHHEFDFHTCCKWHHGISTHADDQLQMLFGRYKLWEVEAIASVVDHAMIRYYQYFQRLAGKWPEKYRHISYPGGGSPGLSASEKCEPDWDYVRDTLYDLVTYGPRFLYRVLRTADDSGLCDLFGEHMHTWSTGFRHVLKRYIPEESVHIADTLTEDDTYGWTWANTEQRETHLTTGDRNRNTLREWGYVFWGRDRLQGWGIKPGGEYSWYDDQGSGLVVRIDIDEEVERRASAAFISNDFKYEMY